MDTDFYEALEYLDEKKLRDKVESQAYEIRRSCRDKVKTPEILELIERAYILGYTKALKEVLEDEE